MNLLLRDFDSKEVAENVAAEILKRGVAKSAQVTDTRGDLAAAQELIAAIWPALNVLEGSDKIPQEARAMIGQLKKDATPLYMRAMGDT